MFLDGRLEAVVGAGARLVTEAEQLGSPVAGLNWSGTITFEPLRYLGRYDEARTALASIGLLAPGHPFGRLRTAICLAESGRQADAQTIFSQVIVDLAFNSPDDETPAAMAVLLLQLAILLEERETLSILLARLKDLGFLAGMMIVSSSIGRHLGAAAALLGKPAEARDYYNQALEVCAKIRFRPEIALTRLGLAELLLDHYPDERPAAIEHLDFAIAEFRAMKMQPSLERALKHKELLKA